MATNTYVALDKVTVATATPSITFSSIPSGYTDLVIVFGNFGLDTSGSALRMRFNSDTNSNYSNVSLVGTGSSTTSGRESSQTSMRIGGAAIGPGTTNSDTGILNIQNYSNATAYKAVLYRGSSATKEVYGISGLWHSTAAINSITLITYNGSDNIQAGSTFSLYGIKAEGVSPAPKATGGAIYSDADYYYHVFGASGTFTPLQSLSADMLVVAGGGGGGSYRGGGGGAGGLLAFTSQSLTATGYTVTVGSGGAGGANNNSGSAGAVGGDSQFGALTLVKGGGGGGAPGSTTGGTGGSGGGSCADPSLVNTPGGTASPAGQGNAGGTGQWLSNYYGAGGGGGAGAAGSNGSNSSVTGANGGVGSSTYSSWGLATGTGQNVSGTYYYAGGGGGGHFTSLANHSGSSGGYGGGGGVPSTVTTGYMNGTSGTPNTGGGGGGTGSKDPSNEHGTGGNGGSGIVIVRYVKV